MIKKFLTFPFRKSKELKEYGGFKNFLKGSLRFLFNWYLVRKYKLNDWHRNPIYWMPYRLEVVKLLNNLIGKENRDDITIVEIGCGLGEILRECKNNNKTKNIKFYGFDINEKVINVAKKLDKDIIFKVGTFDSVVKIPEKRIDILVMISFLHTLSEDDIINYFKILMENKLIKYNILF